MRESKRREHIVRLKIDLTSWQGLCSIYVMEPDPRTKFHLPLPFQVVTAYENYELCTLTFTRLQGNHV